MKKYNHLVMDIVGGCNAKCKYCTTGIKNQHGKPQFTFVEVSEFAKALDYIIEHNFFDYKEGQVELFSWGEPFLHKDINAICNELCKRKMRYRLSTNASIPRRLNKENLTYLDDVCISISGFTQKSYGRIHGLNLDRVLRNIREMSQWFRECGHGDKIVMNFHVYQFNIDEVEMAAQFCRENGIRFLPHIAYLADFDLFNRYMTGKIDQEMLLQISKEVMMGSVENLMENFDPAYECKQRNALVLDEQLRVLPCAFLSSRDHIGSIYEYASVEELDRARDKVEVCHVCHESKTWYLVNQDKYYPWKSDKSAKPYPLPHIYFDRGNGFFENQTIYDPEGMITQEGFMCRFDLPERFISLRFDPAEGSGCLIRNIRVIDELGNLLMCEPLNGEVLDGGALLFHTKDPQISLRFEHCPSQLRISADIDWII